MSAYPIDEPTRQLPTRGAEMAWSSEPGPEIAIDACDASGCAAAAETALPMGDIEQLGAMLAGLEPRLASVALRFTRDPEAARDVVQSAFEKVLRHGDRFRGQSRVSTWIHRIVANEALMWLRSQRRRREDRLFGEDGDLPHLVDSGPGPAEILLQRERALRLGRGLRRLKGDERDVVRSCALEGQSYAEYGRRRGLHPAAVKSRAFRARRHLAHLLQE
jgi:RNA polymerase sigma-70 factor (ECF subfamily)